MDAELSTKGGVVMSQQFKEALRLLRDLEFTARARENTMGCPVDLLHAKRELREACDAAREFIQKNRELATPAE